MPPTSAQGFDLLKTLLDFLCCCRLRERGPDLLDMQSPPGGQICDDVAIDK